MMKHAKLAAALAIRGIVATLLIALGALPGSATDDDPATAPLPQYDYGDPAKSVVVELQFGESSATITNVVISTQRSYSHLGDPPLLQLRLIDDKGNPAGQLNAWDPRWRFEESASGGERLVIQPVAGALTVPFAPALASMLVRDQRVGADLVNVDLRPAIREYCLANPNDPDCRADLRLFKTDSADPAAAGDLVEYTLTVENQGPNPAHAPRVVDTLPAGMSFVSGTPDCTETSPGIVSCNPDAIPAGTTGTATITVRIAPDLVYNAGGPVTLVDSAQVDNPAGIDVAPANNVASEDTRVVAVADLGLSIKVPPTIIGLVGSPSQLRVEYVITNAGPSSPMDVKFQTMRVVDGGLIVALPTAATHTQNFLAVSTSQSKSVKKSLIVLCHQAGKRKVRLFAEVHPLRPDDADPNVLNDRAMTTVTVSCLALPRKLGPFGFPTRP